MSSIEPNHQNLDCMSIPDEFLFNVVDVDFNVI